MGSVPRINYHLAIFLILIESMIVKVALISQKKLHCDFEGELYRSQLYDRLTKGVSIVSYRLPYTLKLVRSYAITSNSKAA